MNGKRYDILNLREDERSKLYKIWRDEGATIECLCHKTNKQYPLMHIKKSKNNTYFASNNSKNSKNHIDHAADCINNTAYRRNLGAKGIKIDDDGTYHFTIINKKNKTEDQQPAKDVTSKVISYSKPGVSTVSESALRYIFLALIEKYDIHHYRSGQVRNIDKRLYKACCETIINQKKLSDMVYIANGKYKYPSRKHQFIIGWGKKDQYTADESTFVSIPMYSVRDNQTHVYDQKIPNWIFSDATFTQAAVSTGYWIIWRDYDVKGTLKDKQIIFVPAEETSMIPVDSSLEELMIKYLIDTNRSFRKPQIRAAGDYMLPDFVLPDEEQDSIIEVAGLLDDPDYYNKLKEKEKNYKNNGYKYIEWDGKVKISTLFND